MHRKAPWYKTPWSLAGCILSKMSGNIKKNKKTKKTEPAYKCMKVILMKSLNSDRDGVPVDLVFSTGFYQLSCSTKWFHKNNKHCRALTTNGVAFYKLTISLHC